MQDILYSLRDMILFSTPEGVFITAITYILLKRFDMLDLYRLWFTIKNLFIPAIGSSLALSLIERLHLGFYLSKLIGLFIFYLILLVVIHKNSFNIPFRFIFKILLSFLVSFFSTIIIESSTALIIMFLLKIDISKLFTEEKYFHIKLLTSFLLIIIESILFSIILFKRENKMVYIIHIIFKNKKLLFASILLFTVTIGIIIEFTKLVLINHIFIKTSMIEQIYVTLGIVVILPILSILMISFVVSILINQQNYYQQLYHNNDLI